jgi:alkylation response protein AidB-like acyl-CoA dehydrogenase
MQELLPEAEKLKAIAAEHAQAADRAGRLDQPVVQALTSSGFSRHFVPAKWGGTSGTFAELTQAVITVGEGCPATAWCASLSAYSGRFAAYLPVAGQEVLWGNGPDRFIVSGLVASGSATEVEGGYRIGGRWLYVSGCEFGDWALLCGPAGDPSVAKFFAVPREKYAIEETWDSVGMKATGSHTLIVDDVFVPSHLIFERSAIMTGRNEHSTAPAHNVPFGAAGGLTFAGPALGAAIGALNTTIAILAGKKHSPGVAQGLARASGEIEAARLLIERVATTLDSAPVTRPTAARCARDSALAAELLVTAVNGLIKAGGTSGLAETSDLQRFWRDVVAATSHVALRFEVSAGPFAESLLAA